MTRESPRDTPSLFRAAMERQSVVEDLARTEGRPVHVTSGYRALDRMLDGGFRTSSLTVLAPVAGAHRWSLGFDAVLAGLNRSLPTALVSRSEPVDALCRLLVARAAGIALTAVESGLVTAEDRVAIGETRRNLRWSKLAVARLSRGSYSELDEWLFSYRPILVVADSPVEIAGSRRRGLNQGLALLASLARKYRLAFVLVEASDLTSKDCDAVETVIENDSDGRLTVSKLAGAVLEPVRTRKLGVRFRLTPRSTR